MKKTTAFAAGIAALLVVGIMGCGNKEEPATSPEGGAPGPVTPGKMASPGGASPAAPASPGAVAPPGPAGAPK